MAAGANSCSGSMDRLSPTHTQDPHLQISPEKEIQIDTQLSDRAPWFQVQCACLQPFAE